VGLRAGRPNPKQNPNSLPTGRQAISNDQNGFVSEIGHLVIGHYLEFGICLPAGMQGYGNFPAKAGFGSRYAGPGV